MCYRQNYEINLFIKLIYLLMNYKNRMEFNYFLNFI